MNRSAIFVLALLTLIPTAACAADARRARLTIGEEVYRVPVGESFAVMLGGERVTMRVEIDDTSEFAEAGVGFRYPAGFASRGGGDDPGVTVWTLEGEAAAVMLQRYEPTIEPASLADAIVGSIVERSGADRVSRKSVKLRGTDRAYDGVRLTIAPAPGDGAPLETVQNVFAFANTEGVFALIVQDSRPAGGGPSDEYAEAVRLLGESFVGGEPPEPDPEPGAEAPAEEGGAQSDE